ncbi:ArsR/SmtB family transcription factor [Microbacterium sp. ASV49]|uniref:Winged helix-turn-helix domain-containing protein n=1 Tax=Microbacterium candidum TaxID=3041922 RepID=A0ABT7MZX3_9MICO|nr:winged helix-turn-helix domain-containing protein [Microbacterium sp. ASV49]MDL9980001.1 winged helix-turn-helix domain-containing protein [Microbacterium sp. ASV49]
MTKDFTAIGRALAAPARSDILNLLMDGSTRPASELADAAGISASTASEHLAALLDAGLVDCSPAGRHRMYRLADGGVAAALEQLGHLCPDSPPLSFRRTREAESLAEARFCYDHLAGRLGVALTAAMVERGWLTEPDLDLTDAGRVGVAARGILLVPSKRRTARPCVDWTERRPHLAGALGSAIGTRFLDAGWVRRIPGGRGLVVTPDGRRALAEWGVPAASLAA